MGPRSFEWTRPHAMERAMSKREESKEDRRRKILSAAETLLRAGDGADFSMRELAKEAGVSFATPFNLFENKAGILIALMGKQVARNREDLEKVTQSESPLENLFQLVAVSVDGYTADPDLLRPLVLTLDSVRGPERRDSRLMGARIWKPALEAARDTGILDSDRNLDLLASSLHLMFRECLSAWAMTEISKEEFKLQALYSLACWILSAASPDFQTEIAERRDTLEQKLVASRST